MKIKKRNIVNCGACKKKNLFTIAKFGRIPLAGYFPLPGEEDESNLINLDLLKCANCSLIQTCPDVSNESLFLDYRYASRYSMQPHFREMANWIKNTLRIPNTAKFLEIGSNDGTLMSLLKSFSYDVQGVDPSKNVTEHAIANGHIVEVDFFSPELVTKKTWEEKFDVVISTNSFAHISDISSIANGISLALKYNGIFILEVQSWPELIRTMSFDFVYHEHKYYYDLLSLNNLLSPFGIFIEQVTLSSIHGGSYRIIFRKHKTDSKSNKIKPFDIVAFESTPSDLQVSESLNRFFINIESLKLSLVNKRKKGIKVIGFGASGRANILLAHMNSSGLLDYILDESPERIGRNLGFSKINILDFESFKLIEENSYDEVLVLAWNFYSDIKAKWPHKNKLLIKPFPFYSESLS